MKAEKLFHEKIRSVDGIVVELKVWRVTVSADYPEGFRYSFFAVRHGVVLVGYDHHAPKGHHRHRPNAKESPYRFRGLDRLRRDFMRDLEQARQGIPSWR